MSNQGSSNRGPEFNNPDPNHGVNQNSQPQSPTPVDQSNHDDPIIAREEQMMIKVQDIVRNAFEEYRKENKDKGKGKVEEEGSKVKGVSFKTFRASGATEFSGSANPVDALEWVENTESVFRIAHVAERDESVYAAALLKGKALTWWKNTYKTLSEEEQAYLVWKEFKTRFLEQYCPSDMRRRLEKEFLELKQGDMSVDEYETTFNQKAQFASKYASNEHDKIQLFVEGLRYEIQDFVTNREILSFGKAVEFARKREYDLSLRGVAIPNPKRQRVDQATSAPTFQTNRFNS
ncbi:retrotransposon gag domain-containing protein, partial [Labilibacter sediminis]